jgi:hypothetical protein
MRQSVYEEVQAANRVASQLLNRTVWGYAAQGPQAMLAYLEGVGRVRSNDITLLDPQGGELYRSPPSPYKAGRQRRRGSTRSCRRRRRCSPSSSRAASSPCAPTPRARCSTPGTTA